MLKTIFLTLAFASLAAAAPPPNPEAPDIDLDKVKLSGDCEIQAQMGNYKEFKDITADGASNIIGYGTLTCKDGSKATFMMREHQQDRNDSGVHVAGIIGYMDGTAKNIFGIYGYYKTTKVFPWWFLGPLGWFPVGTSALVLAQTPTASPLVFFGIAFGVDISEHFGAIEVIEIPPIETDPREILKGIRPGRRRN